MTPRTVDDLVATAAAGTPLRYRFFWGHRGSAHGPLTNSCLSQWWSSPFEVDGVQYATAEHFMMAAKARCFDDTAALGRILAAASPKEAKRIGRTVRGYDDAVWAARRFDAVVMGNTAKFSSTPRLRSFLLETGDDVLVEASPVDRVWGIGLAWDAPAACRPREWRGQNLLGFALMAARDRLRA